MMSCRRISPAKIEENIMLQQNNHHRPLKKQKKGSHKDDSSSVRNLLELNDDLMGRILSNLGVVTLSRKNQFAKDGKN